MDDCITEGLGEWTNEWMTEGNEGVKECRNEGMKEGMNERIHIWMNEWTQ